MTPDIFSNDWITMVMSTYSMAIAAIPAAIGIILKAVAMLNTNVPTDKIRDLLTWKVKEKP
jgi:hypothetical protein